MKTCPKMREVIGKLCDKYGVDLTKQGANIRLDMPGFDRLCIERISGNCISVAHYYELQGDLVAEPDIVFFVDEWGEWVPVEITQSLTGWQRVVEYNDDETKIMRYQKAAQADIAEFAEGWAQNITDQGWLTNAKRHTYHDQQADDDTPSRDAEEDAHEHA